MIDLHIHSCYSDGTDRLDEILQAVQSLGISHFSITDHDTLQGSILMRSMANAVNLPYTVGVEFSCHQFGKRFHILGYNFDETNPVLQKTIQDGVDFRRENCLIRLKHLKDVFSITFDEPTVAKLLNNPTVGKPHIAKVLIDHGYADTVANAIDRYLNVPGKTLKLTVEQAIYAIHSAGGTAIWAHPFGENIKKALPTDQLTQLFYQLIDFGLDGLECFYSQYDPDQQRFLESLAHQNGLLCSGGSDYHGKNKTVALGCTGSDPSVPVADERFTLLQALR